MSNGGRSTTGDAKVPYYRESDVREAAKYLRLTVTRYLAGRALMSDIDVAVMLLRQVAPVPGDVGQPDHEARCPPQALLVDDANT